MDLAVSKGSISKGSLVTGQAPGRATAAGVLLEGNGLASSTFGTFVLEIILSQPVTAVPSTLVVYVKLVDLDRHWLVSFEPVASGSVY